MSFSNVLVAYLFRLGISYITFNFVSTGFESDLIKQPNLNNVALYPIKRLYLFLNAIVNAYMLIQGENIERWIYFGHIKIKYPIQIIIIPAEG